MALQNWNTRVGLNNVGSFQVSGKPFASGSILAHVSGANSIVVRFPKVTKWVQISPHQDQLNRELRVAFSQDGLHRNENFRVYSSGSFTGPLDIKVSELHFMSEDSAVFTFDIVAGLTNIDAASVETAEGPNWKGSDGVG